MNQNNSNTQNLSEEIASTQESQNYDVGFKKPPKHTQFQPGQSGNRNGRPKGSRNFANVIEQELNSIVSITERGKVKQVRKKDIIAKQVVNKAAAGDLKATGMLLNESRYAEQQAALKEVATPSFNANDLQVLHHFTERIRQSKPVSNSPAENVASKNTTQKPSEEPSS
jgi:hypothetical protein